MNEFSENFLNLIEYNWPEWKGKAKPVGDYFEFEVTSLGNSDLKLTIDTDEDDVIIGFGNYHCHWDGLGYESIEDEWKDAVKFINDIINDRIKIVSWFKESRWLGSSWVNIEENYEPRCEFDELVYQTWSGRT